MRKMKDSGVEWIGEIPEDWEVNRIAGLYSLRNTRVSDKDFPPLSVTKNGILPQLETAAKTDDHDNRKLVKKGDFVINSRSDRKGSCGISDYDGSVSLINTVLAPMDEMNPEYFNWVFRSTLFAEEFYKWGNGIVDDLWTTNWTRMRNINVPLPGHEQQKKIAECVNRKTASIDSIVETISQEIETLEAYKKSVITEAVTKGLDKNAEMKDSGIEWIGEIPSEWSTIRLQDIADFKKGPFGSAITVSMFIEKGPNTFKIYEQKNAIQKSNSIGHYYIPENKYRELINFSVKPQDIIVSCAGTIGSTYTLPQDSEAGIINQALMRVRMNELMDENYFKYAFDMVIDYSGEKFSNGSAIKNIPPFNVLKKHRVCYPPRYEQEEIVSYLDKKTQAIDEVIAIKQNQLSLLDEYKKSLIYEYVTGKREV